MPTDNTPSPCRKLCRLDSTGQYCTGCGRNLDELRQWRRWDDAQRLKVMEELPARRLTLPEIQN
jgi:hypothetical protein